MLRTAGVVVCLAAFGLAATAEAQPGDDIEASDRRDLASACVSVRGCIAAGVRFWDELADFVLDILETPVQALERPVQSAGSSVIFDGTFAHPDAPAFYLLKGLALDETDSPADLCGQLPEAVRDPQLLLRMMCEAERELQGAGKGDWPDEFKTLEAQRRHLASCLPLAASGNPCGSP